MAPFGDYVMAITTEDKQKTPRQSASKPEVNLQGDSPSTVSSTMVEVFPLRSYQDQDEIKRRGGPGYSVSKRHADQLIQAGLATDKNPKA